MLKASAMYFALIVSLLMASAAAAFLMAIGFQDRQFSGILQKEAIHRDIDSAVELLLSNSRRISDHKKMPVLFEKRANRELFIERSAWGLWELNRIWRMTSKDTIGRAFLSGYQVDSLRENALYLADLSNELQVKSGSVIHGKMYLPASGWKPYYSANNSGPRPSIKGLRGKSKRHLPRLEDKWLDQRKKGREFSKGDSLMCSFKEDEPCVFFNHLPLRAKGYARLKFDRPVRLTAQHQLSQVIIEAPSVLVESGFEGDVQLFVQDTLIMENNTHLKFPSAVVFVESHQHSYAELQAGAELSGTLANVKDKGSKANLKIEQGALINGLVHWSGRVDLEGQIAGSLRAIKMRHQSPIRISENMLPGGKIVAADLEQYFVAPRLMGKNDQREIVQFLQ